MFVLRIGQREAFTFVCVCATLELDAVNSMDGKTWKGQQKVDEMLDYWRSNNPERYFDISVILKIY